jgi:MFS family permease
VLKLSKAIDDGREFEEELEEEKEFSKDRRQTQALINTANIIDNADGNILAALYGPIKNRYPAIGTERLGAITTARALLQAVSSPLWGWLSDRYSRKLLLGIGCMIWGTFTVILGFLGDFWSMFFVRALTGIGLAVIFPTAQSLIADFFPKSKRGQAFGMLGLTTVLGSIVGMLLATVLGGSELEPVKIMGIYGWRFVFWIVGGFSILLAILIWIFGKDPRRGGAEEVQIRYENKVEKRKTTWTDYKKILTNKTFIFIVLQGIAGTIPWNSILFIVFWLEEIGIGGLLAGISFAMVALGAAFGNLFGGFLGDKAAKKYPDKGRIMIAQISVFSGIPLMFLIFFIIPRFILPQLAINSILILFIFLGIITGFMISWSAPSTNNPIMSELFDPEIRSSAFAVDRLFEGSIAASGTYLVALFANRIFDYNDAIRYTTENVLALSNALLITTIIPWVICLAFYSFIYFTYPKDRDIARKEMMEKYQKANEQNVE